MLVWIDAAAPAARLQVFGLTVTERHLQALMRLDPKPTQVIIDVGSKDPADLRIPARVLKALPIVSSQSTAPFAERLREALRLAGDAPLLVLDGTTLADQRLHGQLVRAEHNLAVFSPDAKESAAMLFLRMAGSVAAPEDATDVTSFARGLVAAGIAEELSQNQFDGFIRKLRRTVPFYMFRILDQTKAAEIQRFLFWSNYKGSTDFFTKYVYPPLVWLMVRPLARAHVHPNWVTIISIILTVAAVPLFAGGYFVAGFLCAYGMSVLDSVDGKLARLTFTDSKIGNVLDHGLDLVHPPFWYCAWAYGLSNGNTSSPVFLAAMVMLALYVIDRLILKVYPTRFGRGLHTHAAMDGFVRTFISRRNINLPLFTVGYAIGWGAETIYLIVLWQAATCLYHGLRTAWILAYDRPAATRSA